MNFSLDYYEKLNQHLQVTISCDCYMADLLCPEQENENWCMLGKCLKANLWSFRSLSDNISCVFWCSLSTANVVQLIYVISFVGKSVMYFSSERNHISCNKMLAWWTNCVIMNARSLTTLARTWDLSSMGAFAERISEVKQLTAHYRHCKLCSNNGFVPICLFLWRRPSYESYILCIMFTLESTNRKRWEPWTVVLKLNQPRWQATSGNNRLCQENITNLQLYPVDYHSPN